MSKIRIEVEDSVEGWNMSVFQFVGGDERPKVKALKVLIAHYAPEEQMLRILEPGTNKDLGDLADVAHVSDALAHLMDWCLDEGLAR